MNWKDQYPKFFTIISGSRFYLKTNNLFKSNKSIIFIRIDSPNSEVKLKCSNGEWLRWRARENQLARNVLIQISPAEAALL